MAHLLTAPAAAVVLAADSSLADALRDGAGAADLGTVYGVDTIEAAIETVADHDDVGVAVVTDDGVDLLAACDRLASANDRLPIIAAIDVDDGERVAAATQAGASTVVDRDDVAAVAAAADAAIDRYERRRREHAESSMFTTLLEDIGVSVYVKDDQARHLRLANVPGGPDPATAIGKTDAEIYGDADSADETESADRRVIQEGKTIRDEREHFEGEGYEVWTETTKVPWRDEDGEIQGIVGLSLNVTDQVETVRRLESFETEFERFADSLAHDLRNPLQVASGQLALARETGDEAAFRKTSDALDRMDEIIADLKALNTSEAIAAEDVVDGGGVDLTAVTDVSTTLSDVWTIVGSDAATLSNRFHDGAFVVSPEATVRPVIENLLRNAVDHAGHDVTVEVGPLADWSGFYVADDGPGVPPEKRDAVFADGYTTSEDGTGTGLSIVAESIEERDWTIDLGESAEGGARFEIGNCPLVDDPSSEATPTATLSLEGGVDVGDLDADCGETYDDAADTWTVTGAGDNVWRDSNEFRFVRTVLEGDVRIEGRVTDPAALGEYSKSAFVVRDGDDSDATYGGVATTPGHGTELLWRTAPGAPGTSYQFGEEPDAYPWYRVDRVGDVVTCYASADGEDWHAIDQRRVALSDPVSVGIAVCSVVAGSAAEATFADVRLQRLASDAD